ncbi:MAG: ribbon-helix-helix domain-containing protein [Promethearchaeota archaeon]
MMTNISVFLDDDLIVWIDQLVKNGIIKNRSEAIRGGLYSFIQQKLGINSVQDLREHLAQKSKKPFQSGVSVIKEIREEKN